MKRKKNALRNQAAAQIELLHQTRYSLSPVIRLLKNIVFLVQQISAGEVKHRKAGLRFGFAVANDIRICQCTGCHQLLLTQILYRLQAITQTGGKLKFQVFCCGQHLLPDLIRDRLIVPPEQFSGLQHGLPVFRTGFPLLTPSSALVHVIIQAWSSLPHIPGKLQMAAGKLQRQSEGLHDIMGNTSPAEGAKVLRPIITELTDQRDSGVDFPHIQPEIGISLVILQKNVVFRQISFDQGAFQHQCLKL